MNTKKAVVVAAGISSRLYPLTLEKPKCLIQINSVTLLKRSILLLRKNGIDQIAVVVGFHRQKIMDAMKDIPRVDFIFNPFFRETNNLASLGLARPFIDGDPFIYLHSDIIYEENILIKCLSSKPNSLVVDENSIDEEAMKVMLVGQKLIESSKSISLNKAGGEWIGMALFKKNSSIFDTIDYVMEERKNFLAYDTTAFNKMVRSGEDFSVIFTEGTLWKEIDTDTDLSHAEKLFRNSAQS